MEGDNCHRHNLKILVVIIFAVLSIMASLYYVCLFLSMLLGAAITAVASISWGIVATMLLSLLVVFIGVMHYWVVNRWLRALATLPRRILKVCLQVSLPKSPRRLERAYPAINGQCIQDHTHITLPTVLLKIQNEVVRERVGAQAYTRMEIRLRSKVKAGRYTVSNN